MSEETIKDEHPKIKTTLKRPKDIPKRERIYPEESPADAARTEAKVNQYFAAMDEFPGRDFESNKRLFRKWREIKAAFDGPGSASNQPGPELPERQLTTEDGTASSSSAGRP